MLVVWFMEIFPILSKMTCFATCDCGLTPREAFWICADFCGRFVAPEVTVFI